MVGQLQPDLMLLDVMLPGANGFEVLKRIRATSRVPVLMLTARGDEVDRIANGTEFNGTFLLDGTGGSAVGGRFKCWAQSAADTPEAFIKAAVPGGMDLMADWKEVRPAPAPGRLRQCWENFLRHVGGDAGKGAPYLPTLVEGAKAVQLADLAYRSVAEKRWIDVPELKLA